MRDLEKAKDWHFMDAQKMNLSVKNELYDPKTYQSPMADKRRDNCKLWLDLSKKDRVEKENFLSSQLWWDWVLTVK